MKNSSIVLIILGIAFSVIGFFGEIYTILRSTLINQIIFGIILIIGLILIGIGLQISKWI